MRIYLLVLVALTACVTPEDEARQRAQYANALRNRCYAYGFKPGDAAMANCMMQLDMVVQQRKAANDAASMGLAMQLLGSQSQSPQQGVSCWRMGDYLQCR